MEGLGRVLCSQTAWGPVLDPPLAPWMASCIVSTQWRWKLLLFLTHLLSFSNFSNSFYAPWNLPVSQALHLLHQQILQHFLWHIPGSGPFSPSPPSPPSPLTWITGMVSTPHSCHFMTCSPHRSQNYLLKKCNPDYITPSLRTFHCFPSFPV